MTTRSKITIVAFALVALFSVPLKQTTAQVKKASNSDLKKMESVINEIAKEHIPHKYEKQKEWGRQSERWDGLHIQLKNFKLKTKRRKKLVNHGDWKKYSAELIDPKSRLKIRLNSVKKSKQGNANINLEIEADLKLFGRYSKWVKGVQLFSLSADALATVVLQVNLEIGTELDLKNFPPDLILHPKATSAKLIVKKFRVLRVSKLGGEFAEQVTQGVRGILDDKVKEQEVKLVSKINRSINKKKDKLRLSVRELVDSEWSKFAEDYLPKELPNIDSPNAKPVDGQNKKAADSKQPK